MTTDELLKPRYKVIALYPDCDFKIGQIIEFNDGDEDGELVFTHSEYWSPKDFDEFPHLFKALSWWEERPIYELPHYIRFGDKDKVHAVYKIKEWNKGDGIDEGLIENLGPCGIAESPIDYFISLRFKDSHPATKEEYDQQSKTNK